MNKTNILLYGSGGSGKTTSIISILKLANKFPDIKLRFIITEHNSLLGIRFGLKFHNIKLKPEQLVYYLAEPEAKDYPNLNLIIRNYESNFHNLSNKEAKSVRVDGSDRRQYTAFLKFMKGLNKFKGVDLYDNSEVVYENYLKWDNNVILVVDSMTSVIEGLIEEVKANRVATRLDDYGTVQQNFMTLIIRPMTSTTRCSTIFIGHPVLSDDPMAKQPSLESGLPRIQKVYPDTFGTKLNEKLASKFTDTIYQYSEGNNFYWLGESREVCVSVRNIPRKKKLIPDFSHKDYTFFE